MKRYPDPLPLLENLKTLGHAPRVHPNGFIQFDLNSDGSDRLHIWDHRIPRQDTATTTHDHKFLMHSKVYRGVLAQVVYGVDLNHGSNPTDEIYMAKYTSRSESKLVPTGVKVARTTADVELLHGDENDSYSQPPFTFHDSVPVVFPVVTWMTKLTDEPDHTPRILVPLGQTPDNDFERTAHDPDFLWEVIAEAIA
jgi:hypothetical protein